MTYTNIKNKQRGGPRLSPVIAAVAGVVVGAGVAVAGAVAMADKKNQEKVKKLVTIAKNTSTEVKKI